MIARTPNTFVVGAGPVATALAGSLRLGGVPVLGLWARNPAGARSAGATAGVAAFSAAPPDLLLEADVVVLAVNDDAVGEVARKLVATGLITRKHVMMHCSGVMSAENAFAGVRDRVGGVATLHPLRSIPDGREAMRTMAGTVFGIEGDEPGRREALALVRAVGGQPLELSGEQMAAYHAAAAMASNYLVTLLDLAAGILGAASVSPDAAMNALLHLARGTLDNVGARGAAEALTGPIARGDRETVSQHLAAIEQLSPQAATVYRELGLHTLAIARKNRPQGADEYDAIESLLRGEPLTAKSVSQ